MQSLDLNSALAWGSCRARSRFNLGGEWCPHTAHVSAREVGVSSFFPPTINLWRVKLQTKTFGRATSAIKGVMLSPYLRETLNPRCKLPKAVTMLTRCQAEVAASPLPTASAQAQRHVNHSYVALGQLRLWVKWVPLCPQRAVWARSPVCCSALQHTNCPTSSKFTAQPWDVETLTATLNGNTSGLSSMKLQKFL